MMLGSGAVGFMNAGAPPQILTFSSTLTKDAHVQVVVGRKKPSPTSRRIPDRSFRRRLMPPTFTYPGVYIEEIPSAVHTITGVATSIAAFVGWAPEGPTKKRRSSRAGRTSKASLAVWTHAACSVTR